MKLTNAIFWLVKTFTALENCSTSSVYHTMRILLTIKKQHKGMKLMYKITEKLR